MDCKKFSTLSRLLHVTAYVLIIVEIFKGKIGRCQRVECSELSSAEIAEAESRLCA